MKKFFKYCFLAFAAIAILFVAIAAQAMFRFDVMIFPVNNHIMSNSRPWGHMVSLTPDIFSPEDSIEKINRKLAFAGYTKTPSEHVWGIYKDRSGENKYIYMRRAGTLVCNINLYVFIELDQDGKLKSAEGTQQEAGCL